MPEKLVKERLNQYKEQSVSLDNLSAEDKLLAAIFGGKTTLMVKCNGCGKWLRDEEALYINCMAYHYSCSDKIRK